jgi:surfeit locus 1 family protein
VLNDYYYRPVETKGKFRHDQEILLGPRSIKSKPGYFLITPLERKDG